MPLKIKTFFLTLLILSIGLCKFVISSELKISAIEDLLKSNFKGEKFIDSEIQFPVSSAEKCEEEKDSMILILKDYLKGLKDVECEEAETDLVLSAKFQLPMVKMKQGQYEVTEGLYNLTVSNQKNIKIGLYQNTDEFTELNKKLEGKKMELIKAEDINFRFDITNDIQKELNLKMDSVYTSGKAFPKRASVKLEPEQTLTFTLSQILLASISERGHVDFMTIEVVEKPDK
jgi:hypothetical protein